jgi:hypothetical protein
MTNAEPLVLSITRVVADGLHAEPHPTEGFGSLTCERGIVTVSAIYATPDADHRTVRATVEVDVVPAVGIVNATCSVLDIDGVLWDPRDAWVTAATGALSVRIRALCGSEETELSFRGGAA